MSLGFRLTLTSLAIALVGCKQRALEPGSYEVVLDQVLSNTCGTTDEDLGVGVPFTVEVDWDGDVLVVDGFGPSSVYAWDGTAWTVDWDEDLFLAQDCTMRSEVGQELTIASETSFAIEETTFASGIGPNCDQIDEPSLPCSVSVGYTGGLSE